MVVRDFVEVFFSDLEILVFFLSSSQSPDPALAPIPINQVLYLPSTIIKC